jgi:ribosomal protein L12E/L44/L45/RPP1/RPP2
MATLSLSSALFVVASTAAGGGVAWLATALHFRTKLAEIAAQFELAERAKLKAQELAVQSRQQVEALQQALSEVKRDGVIQNAASSARAAAAAAEAAKAAQAKARAELMRQLETADKDERSHGFADTQPFRNN